MDKYKHNYKLDNEDKKTIMIEYLLNKKNDNVNNLCSKYNISRTTFYNIVKSKEGKELLNKHITENKQNFTKKLELILDKTYNKLNTALDSDNISARDLSIIGATTYDKLRLQEGLSTENKAINININIEK
jgi:hypothetical protein